QQFEHLARDGRRQLFEQRRAVVRRHVVENGGHFVLGHGLEQSVLIVVREVFEGGGGVLARQHAIHDHLVGDRQFGERFGHVLRGPVAHHVVQPRKVARLAGGGKFIGGFGDAAYCPQRFLPVWAV